MNENVVLRDNEVAVLPSGVIIMNASTLLELASKYVNNQSASASGASAGDAASADKKGMPNEEEATECAAAVMTQENKVPANSGLPGSPAIQYVYVDNFGNIFGSMSEFDQFHGLKAGTGSALYNRKMRVGWNGEYLIGIVRARKELLLPDIDTTADDCYFDLSSNYSIAVSYAKGMVDEACEDNRYYFSKTGKLRSAIHQWRVDELGLDD